MTTTLGNYVPASFPNISDPSAVGKHTTGELSKISNAISLANQGLAAGVAATAANTTAIATNTTAIAANTSSITAINTTLGLLGTHITNSISADVALNNVSNFFDGPVITQGSVGTWFVSGTVTVRDTSNAGNFQARLWDGTTVVASAVSDSAAAGFIMSITLSGFIVAPVGNLRISVRETNVATGSIIFNSTGLSKDSTITAFRIA